ncbi:MULTISPECIES: YcxB family protein [Streptomyces]|uniref:YcxB family protein n=1 Tax=Streptomyces TaxID=1883 RepID=UPI00224E80E5|nr:YcxB family protein [Streptomyces sp. NBC_00160]MCX5306298.1 YcxB family protein [Streptomyces sp. NBC_00160]
MSEIRETAFSATGSVTRDEYDEAARAAGFFRRGRVVAVLGTVLLASAGVTLSSGGLTVHPVPLAIAVAYGLVALLVLPRWAVAQGFRSGRAAEEKRVVVDGTGVEVFRGGESQRIVWDEVRFYHETPRLHVFVGRSRRRTCLVVLPKRLFTAPGESELLAAFGQERAGDGS